MPALERAYTRALRILGVESPGAVPLQIAQLLTPVTVVADVSDTVEPHQNPMFGFFSARAAPAAGQNLIVELQATARPIRVWLVRAPVGTTPRMGIFTATQITAAAATLQCAPIAPVGVDPAATTGGHTAVLSTGELTGAGAFGTLASFQIPATPWAVPRPFLIAPGSFFTIIDTTSADAMSAGAVWEELPRQTEVNVGFPQP